MTDKARDPFLRVRGSERWLWRLLWLAMGALAFVGASCLVLITLGNDEGWLLMGIEGILEDRPVELYVAPAPTSGGVYALAQLLVDVVFGPSLTAHRLVSFGCTAAVLWLVWKHAADRYGGVQAGAIAVATLMATPGLFELGCSAYATLPAVLMLLLTLLAFARPSRNRWVRVLTVGVLAGLTSATRWNMVIVLPALVVASFLRDTDRRREVADALLSAVIALPVLAGSIFLLRLTTELGDEVGLFRESHLADGLFDYPRYLNKWMVAQAFSPLPLLAIASLGGIYALWGLSGHQSPVVGKSESRGLYAWAPLLPFAWMAWAVWGLRAPVPHLRYLFPALSAFAILGGLGLAALHAVGRDENKPQLRIAALVVALACVLTGLVSVGRNVVQGNGDILSWEWSGESRVTYFTRFRNRLHEQSAVEYLRSSVGPDESVLAIPFDRTLGYLAQRDVLEVQTLMVRGLYDPRNLPKKILITPVVGNYIQLSDATRRWIETNCRLAAQFGPYSFYELIGAYPEDPELLMGTVEKYPRLPLSARP